MGIRPYDLRVSRQVCKALHKLSARHMMMMIDIGGIDDSNCEIGKMSARHMLEESPTYTEQRKLF